MRGRSGGKGSCEQGERGNAHKDSLRYIDSDLLTQNERRVVTLREQKKQKGY